MRTSGSPGLSPGTAAPTLAPVIEPSARSRVRLAELLAVLSLGTDLGMGQPMEHVMRECLIALRLAERVGLDESGRAVVYYVALLAWVGCHVDAYEQAKWFGDEMALKSDFRHTDFGAVAAQPLFILGHAPARQGQRRADLRALGRQGRSEGSQGRADPPHVPAGRAGRRGRGLPPGGRH